MDNRDDWVYRLEAEKLIRAYYVEEMDYDPEVAGNMSRLLSHPEHITLAETMLGDWDECSIEVYANLSNREIVTLMNEAIVETETFSSMKEMIDQELWMLAPNADVNAADVFLSGDAIFDAVKEYEDQIKNEECYFLAVNHASYTKYEAVFQTMDEANDFAVSKWAGQDNDGYGMRVGRYYGPTGPDGQRLELSNSEYQSYPDGCFESRVYEPPSVDDNYPSTGDYHWILDDYKDEIINIIQSKLGCSQRAAEAFYCADEVTDDDIIASTWDELEPIVAERDSEER